MRVVKVSISAYWLRIVKQGLQSRKITILCQFSTSKLVSNSSQGLNDRILLCSKALLSHHLHLSWFCNQHVKACGHGIFALLGPWKLPSFPILLPLFCFLINLRLQDFSSRISLPKQEYWLKLNMNNMMITSLRNAKAYLSVTKIITRNRQQIIT